ncbi:MAG: EamA family transporter [Chloroflexi bacterium]|jgi:drug/metabolite transporter (DMT)-like permease|nr:EamA family transporter [Chloroflexota bacterium]
MNKSTAVVIALLLVDSLHLIFARLLLPYLPPTSSSFYYMTIATVQIALYAAVRRQIDWHVFRDNAKFFLVIGFLIATATATSYTAVVYIDPGTASLIARMSTIFALGFGIFWLKERFVRGEKIGAAIAVGGVFIISFQPGGRSDLLWLGTMLVLVSTFCYALHAAIVKKFGGEMDFTNFFLFRMASSSLFLLIFAAGRGELVWPEGREVWLILLLTATVNVTISRSLYYIVLRRFKLSILTIILTLSPVITILWSMALFDERPSLQGLLGGTAVILGVILVTMSKRTEKQAVR